MARVIFHHPLSADPNSTDNGFLNDKFGRALRDLRISVTDKCNFRCAYCMPREVYGADFAFLPRKELLSFDEITRFAQIAVNHGVQKLRLTGGEPLMRKNLEELIRQLAGLRDPHGNKIDISMTTNGALLSKKAAALYKAGLSRITVSLDALDNQLFTQMSDSKVHVSTILNGIKIAQYLGMQPIKINMVVRKGVNDAQIILLVEYFRNSGCILRFIEFMDVGNTNGWCMDEVLTSKEIASLINKKYPIEPINPNYPGEVAKRWRYLDGAGEIGFISSVSQPFCGSCTRLRLSPDGKLFTCLFANHGHDVKAMIRANAPDADIARLLAGVWQNRTDRYSEQRGASNIKEKIEMSYIGG